MPVAYLNNASTQDAYVDALTVQFARPRPAFSVQIANAGAFYNVGVIPPNGRDIAWEPSEHLTTPALLTFRDPTHEGFPPGSLFAGIRFRSSFAGSPASVTVA